MLPPIVSVTGRAKSYVFGYLSCVYGGLYSVKRYFDVGVLMPAYTTVFSCTLLQVLE